MEKEYGNFYYITISSILVLMGDKGIHNIRVWGLESAGNKGIYLKKVSGSGSVYGIREYNILGYISMWGFYSLIS